LRTVQEADGSWAQNCWLDGKPYWHGLQLDECALPILLVDLAWRMGAIRRPQVPLYWPMVRAAAGFVVRNGPTTSQDRWEENAGYTPFTLAAEIAALLAAADIAELCEPGDAGTEIAGFLRDTADAWEAQIEDWLYVTDTALAREVGVKGHGGGAQSRYPQRGCRRRHAGQRRHPGIGAFRPARGRRPAHRGQRPGDRPRVAPGAADRPRLAPLQRRRLR
jgi:GH15 family glucan-1,4-alpha-glucosidase